MKKILMIVIVIICSVIVIFISQYYYFSNIRVSKYKFIEEKDITISDEGDNKFLVSISCSNGIIRSKVMTKKEYDCVFGDSMKVENITYNLIVNLEQGKVFSKKRTIVFSRDSALNEKDFDDLEVQSIKEEIKSGKISYKTLAKKYNCYVSKME